MKIRVAILVTVTLALTATAADWPQWRGPDRNGVSKETGLLKSWPAGGPKLAWSFKELGPGFSSPAVVGKYIYIAGMMDKTESLFALDSDGKKVWEAKLGPTYDFKGNQWSSGPLGSPVVDDDRIYLVTSAGLLACVTTQGSVKWTRSLPKELGGAVDPIGGGPEPLAWGYAWSPLVDGDKVICVPGGSKGLLAALDKNTGDLLWQSREVTDKSTYSSPMPATVGGIKHYVQMVQNGVVGIGTDGKLLWEYRRDSNYPDVVCPTPLVHDNHVFLTAWGGGNELLKLSAAGGKVTAEVVYQKRDLSNRQGGVVCVGDYVYGYNDTRNWVCLELRTGEVKWKSPIRGFPVGSIVAADGLLYLVAEAKPKGGLALVEATAEKYNVLSQADLPEPSSLRRTSGKMWTHPVIANGKLYLRDQEMLYCYDVK